MSKVNTRKKIYVPRRVDSRCRSCLKICDGNHNTNLFKPCNSHILLIAEQLLGEALQRDDYSPYLLCRPCVRRFNNLNQFKNVILRSQQNLAAECRVKRCVEVSPSLLPAAKTSKHSGTTAGADESTCRRGLLFHSDRNKVIFKKI